MITEQKHSWDFSITSVIRPWCIAGVPLEHVSNARFSVLPGWKCIQWDGKPGRIEALEAWVWHAWFTGTRLTSKVSEYPHVWMKMSVLGGPVLSAQKSWLLLSAVRTPVNTSELVPCSFFKKQVLHREAWCENTPQSPTLVRWSFRWHRSSFLFRIKQPANIKQPPEITCEPWVCLPEHWKELISLKKMKCVFGGSH